MTAIAIAAIAILGLEAIRRAASQPAEALAPVRAAESRRRRRG